MSQEELSKNTFILGGMIQGCMWQFETIGHEFGMDAKRRINMFRQYGYTMVDKIYDIIKDDEDAKSSFDSVTADAVDFFRTYQESTNKELLLSKMRQFIKEEKEKLICQEVCQDVS